MYYRWHSELTRENMQKQIKTQNSAFARVNTVYLRLSPRKKDFAVGVIWF